MRHLRLVRARATIATFGVALAAPVLALAPSAGAQGDVCVDTDFGGVRLIDHGGATPRREYSDPVVVDLPAGTYDVTGSSRDGYAGREGATQLSERWELQFLDEGGSVIATSAMSDDLPDRVRDAAWSGSMGSVTLPVAATAVRAHHRPDAPADGSPNSLHATASVICGGVDASTTVAPTTAAPTTAPPTTAAPTTAPLTSEPAPTTAPVRVEGSTTIPGPGVGVESDTSGPRGPGDNLAATGTTSQSLTGAGLVAFGLGVLILGARASLRPRRP